MTFHSDSQSATNVKPEMIPGVRTRNGIPHDKYNIRRIAHVHTNRKDDIFMQRRLYIGKAHTVLFVCNLTMPSLTKVLQHLPGIGLVLN